MRSSGTLRPDLPPCFLRADPASTTGGVLILFFLPLPTNRSRSGDSSSAIRGSGSLLPLEEGRMTFTESLVLSTPLPSEAIPTKRLHVVAIFDEASVPILPQNLNDSAGSLKMVLASSRHGQ